MVVVDATKFVAGPFASLLLQDFGATVIKVDPVGGEDFRAVAGASSSALNRDKAQVGLDLAEAADKERFYSLVDRADVLIENMSRKVVDKLGIDPDRLRSGKGNLVHCHIEGWGAGPLEDTPAFDPLLQARSGLMVAQGGPETPVIQAASVHDIGTGTFAAFGILAALYARTHLQTGPDVRMSLSRASIAFQGAEFTTFAGRHEPPTGHLDYLGEGPAHRLYRCSDGWVAIGAASPATRDALDRVAGGRLGERTSTAETTFATRTVASVLAACRAAEVPAVRVLPRDEIFTSDDLAENEFFLTIADDDLGEIQAVRGFSEWDGVPPRGHAMTRAAGSDTDAVLQGNGALTPRPI
jgi:crotonobetainyl-CoA:carnitine CoA-transferase CaiB-like acyl-CoA transferase